MVETITNKHGRKPGRGLRPWLLIPTVLAAGVYLGAVATCTVIYATRDPANTAPVIEQVSRLFRFMVVPTLLTTLALGVALLMQHPMVFLRMRWLQVKLALLLMGVPTAHFFMSSHLRAIRIAVADGVPYDQTARQMTWGFVVLLAGSALIIAISRHKPRLWQNRAKLAASSRTAAE